MKYLILILMLISTSIFSEDTVKREINFYTGYPYYYEDEPKPINSSYHIKCREILQKNKVELKDNPADTASQRIPDKIIRGITNGEDTLDNCILMSKNLTDIEDLALCLDVITQYIKHHTNLEKQEKWEKEWKNNINTKLSDNETLNENSAADILLYGDLMYLTFKSVADYTNEDVLIVFKHIKMYKNHNLELPKCISKYYKSDNLIKLAYGRF